MKLYVTSSSAGHLDTEAEETKFRSYNIDHIFNRPARCNIVLADVDGTVLQKYTTVDTFKAAHARDDAVYTDETTAAQNATIDDMHLVPDAAVAQAGQDFYYFGFSKNTISGMLLNISTGAVWGSGVITWKYSDGAGSLANLAGVTDGTNQLTNSGVNAVTWTIPGDWVTDTVNGDAGLYWIVIAVTTSETWVGGEVKPIGAQAWGIQSYIGSGKVRLEDPNATDVFLGRIIRVVANTEDRTVILECEDYMGQLADEEITYDMREDLDGSGLRQSVIYPDYDDTDGLGIRPAYNNAGTKYVYDSQVGLTANAHNGQNLVLTAGMAGSGVWETGPYAQSDSGALFLDAFDNDIGDLWTYDDDAHNTSKAGAYWTEYDFRTWVTDSDFYVSISAAKVTVSYTYGSEFTVQLYNGATYNIIGALAGGGSAGDDRTIETFDIPASLLSGMHDANGECIVRFDTQVVGGGALNIHYLEVEITTVTTGYSTTMAISDGETYRLTIDTDLSADATKVWHGLPYCVADEIYTHINGLVTTADTQHTMTTSVESTSGISTRQYKDKSTLSIIQDLARQDMAVFYTALGTAQVTYVKTFGASTETMSDATPDSWISSMDYLTMFNRAKVYGVRLGDYEIFQEVGSEPSESQYGISKTKTIKGSGVVSDSDALEVATTLSARDSTLQQMVNCTLSGFDTTYRLGTIVEITSSYLWATAAKDYIVYRWGYDSTSHKTTLTLHPKVSIGLQDIRFIDSAEKDMREAVGNTESDKYITDPITHEVP